MWHILYGAQESINLTGPYFMQLSSRHVQLKAISYNVVPAFSSRWCFEYYLPQLCNCSWYCLNMLMAAVCKGRSRLGEDAKCSCIVYNPLPATSLQILHPTIHNLNVTDKRVVELIANGLLWHFLISSVMNQNWSWTDELHIMGHLSQNVFIKWIYRKIGKQC